MSARSRNDQRNSDPVFAPDYGLELVEFEQNGEDRAEYGARLIQRVATDLKSRDIGGLGASMLKDCRTFYRLYPQIRQPAVGELPVGGLLPFRQPLIGESAALEQTSSSQRTNKPSSNTPDLLQQLIEADRAVREQRHPQSPHLECTAVAPLE